MRRRKKQNKNSRRGYYNKGPYDADAEAVMAKARWERMEEQELNALTLPAFSC